MALIHLHIQNIGIINASHYREIKRKIYKLTEKADQKTNEAQLEGFG
jgi:hypothetical protein